MPKGSKVDSCHDKIKKALIKEGKSEKDAERESRAICKEQERKRNKEAATKEREKKLAKEKKDKEKERENIKKLKQW